MGKIYFNETDTEFHDKSERTYSIHPNDPLTAEAEMKQSRSIRKGKLKIKLKTYSHQKSTKTHYIISAWCKCWENGKLIHSVDWDYNVPRKGM